jgi:hypothetical protein
MNILLYVSILLSILFTTTPSANAKVYKWLDEDGKVHYGDREINGVKQKTIDLKNKKSNWSKRNIMVKTQEVELTPKEIQEIIDGVNNVYEFFDRVLFFDIYKTVPVNILVLKDTESYYQYLVEKTGRKPTPSYGVYYRAENQIIVYIQDNRELTFNTIKHEVAHAIIDTIIPYSPAWLNEGLAEQMETLTKRDDKLHISRHKINYYYTRQLEKNNRLIGISEFLKMPSNKWRHSLSQRQTGLQAQSGEFVYFLLTTPPDRSFVVRLMHNFARGNRTISYYLVGKNYIGGIKTLEIKWKNWLKGTGNNEVIL